MRGEVIVSRTGLQNVDKSESTMSNRRLEDICHHGNISGPCTRNECRLEGEHEIHGIQCVFRHAIRGTIHRLPLQCKAACLPRRPPIVAVIMEYKGNRVVAADTVDKMSHTFGKTRAVAAKGEYWNLGICEFCPCSKRDDATMKTVEAVAE